MVLAADVINNNAVANTIADVTGLSFPVTEGQTFWFYFIIPYTSAATTTGCRWSVSGPASAQLTAHQAILRELYEHQSTQNAKGYVLTTGETFSIVKDVGGGYRTRKVRMDKPAKVAKGKKPKAPPTASVTPTTPEPPPPLPMGGGVTAQHVLALVRDPDALGALEAQLMLMEHTVRLKRQLVLDVRAALEEREAKRRAG